MLKQINLLPDSKLQRAKAQKTKQLVTTVTLVVIGVAIGLPVLLFVLKGGQTLLLNRTQAQIDERIITIQSTENISTILTVKDHMNSLPPLYQQRVIGSELLSYVTQVMPREVRLSNIEIDIASQTITFTGLVPTYSVAEKFYKSLQATGVEIIPGNIEPDLNSNGHFTNVVLSDVSGPSGSEVSFAINASFSLELIDGVAQEKEDE